MKKVGEFIRAKRKFYGLTTRGLEKKAGVSFNSISRIERSLQIPSLDVLHRLLKALSTSWIEFTSATGYAEPLDPLLEKIIQVTSQLSPDKQRDLLRSLEEIEHLKTPSKTRKAR